MLLKPKLLIFAIILNSTPLFAVETDFDDDTDTNIPSFRIVAPKFLCDDAPADDSVPAPNEITITTQTRGGQKLTYRVQIFFDVLGKLKGQQHTLSIWKSVRQLQSKIASDKDEISLKNQISVHNSQLTPGVQYTFQIVGIDSAGRESNSQNFTIVYREGKFGTEIQQDGTSVTEEVSLLLIGSETAYGDMPIIIEARSIWCTPNNDFYMKWDIKPADTGNRLLDYFSIKGKLLRIPSGILKADETYQISVQLLKNEDDKIITKAEMRLTIMSREYSARILPEILMVGINKEIEISLILRDSDNTGNKFNVMWSCQLADGTTCENFNPSETATQTIEFYSKGDYKISAVIMLNGVSKTLNSNIIVNPDIIAYPQILNLPTRAISANDNFELSAIINDLVPNCYAEWIVLKADGFSYFNETQIAGGLGNMTIHDVEETFLSELVDYGNDTITRSIPLKIPKPNREWPGLVANSKYKFRLKIICPEPIDDSKSGTRKNIESFTDVVIETNAPPVPQPMEVEPLAGDSLRTLFKFTTGVAKDRFSDYPLKYVFYYIIDGFVINLGEFYENMVTTTDLPYSKDGIQTYYQVCDSRDACSNNVPGPNITITLVENITVAELAYKKSFIQQNMETMNLESSFNTAISCLLTYQHFTDQKYFNEIKRTIIEAIKSTIAKIKNQEVFIYSNDEILYFIKLSKKILDVIDYKEKDIYIGLLELLDNIDEYGANDESGPLTSRMVDLFADIRQRVKRSEKKFANQQVNQKDLSRDKIITVLELYEKLVNDDELTDFIKRVEQEIKIFCKDIKDQRPLVYAKDYIAFEAIKTYDPQQFLDHALVVPFAKYPGNKSKFSFSKKLQFPLDGNYCYAKIFYPKRNNPKLAENEDIYEFMLFQNGVVKKFHPAQQKKDKNFMYEIPIVKVGAGKSLKCAVRTEVAAAWDNTNCETTEVTESVIKCNCLNFGLFKADEFDLNAIVSNPITTVTPAENPNGVTGSTVIITIPTTTTTVTHEQSTTMVLTTTIVAELDKITTSAVPVETTMTTVYVESSTASTSNPVTIIPGTVTSLQTTSTITRLPETTTLVLTSTNPSDSVTLNSKLTEATTFVLTSTNPSESVTLIANLPETTTPVLTSTNPSDSVTLNANLTEATTFVLTSTNPSESVTLIANLPETTTPVLTSTNPSDSATVNAKLTEATTFVLTSANPSESVTLIANSPEVTTLESTFMNTTDSVTLKSVSDELSKADTTTATTKPDINTIPEISTKSYLPAGSNSLTTANNVEIINQTIKSLQVKDELTTIETKLGNNIATNGQTNDTNITNDTNDVKFSNAPTVTEIITNSTADASDRSTIASIGISAALSFAIFCGFFAIIFGVLYNKRKQKSTVQEMEIATSSVRQPSQGIRYARFYDTKNMGGNGHFDVSPII